MFNNHLFNRMPPFENVEYQDAEPQLPQEARPGGPIRRLWQAWLWLTSPHPERFGEGIVGQERLRRSRLISALLLLVAVVIALLIPSTLTIPTLWQPILIQALLGVLAALLNRSGQVTWSGLTVIVLADISISQNILRQPYGLTNTTLADLYLLVIPILIAGMVLPNIFIPLSGAVQVLISIFIFCNLPHDTLLNQEIQKVDGNQSYTSILGPILLYVCGAGIVWLYAWSVDRAILRASRAEELAAAHAHIDEQARQIAAQKQRLEHGIHALQEVQAHVANGEYSTRVSLQGNELLPLGVSFNIMAERLGRFEHIEQDHQHLQSALQQLIDACNTLERGGAPASLRPTDTVVDRIFPFLAHLYQLRTQLQHGSALADDLRAVLQRQYEYLSEQEKRLLSSLSLARELVGETAQAPAPEERISGRLDTLSASSSGSLRAKEQSDALFGASSRIKSQLDQQINLLEQAKKYGAQASDLGRRCTRGAQFLSQQLKEAG